MAADLSSFSMEEVYKEIEREWIQAATGLFNSLAEKYKEYKRAAFLRGDLQAFLQNNQLQTRKLQMRLSNLEREHENISPLRKKYLELKIKVISNLTDHHTPNLEDIRYRKNKGAFFLNGKVSNDFL